MHFLHYLSIGATNLDFSLQVIEFPINYATIIDALLGNLSNTPVVGEIFVLYLQSPGFFHKSQITDETNRTAIQEIFEKNNQL